MRYEVIQLADLGPFPSSNDCDVSGVRKYQSALELIKGPVTNEEALALLKVFGPDDFFGLVWRLIQLIETAPGWPSEEVFRSDGNEWIQLLKIRAENAARSRSRQR